MGEKWNIFEEQQRCNSGEVVESECDCPFCREDVNSLVETMKTQKSHLGVVKAVTEYMCSLPSAQEAEEVLACLLGFCMLFIASGNQGLANHLLDMVMQTVMAHTNDGAGHA